LKPQRVGPQIPPNLQVLAPTLFIKAAKRWDRQPISKSRKLVSVPVLPN